MTEYALQRSALFMDSWLKSQTEQHDLPGFVVGVYYKDRFVFKQAFGMANLQQQEKLTVDHLFNIGSQAKMFTALAMLKLVENQELKLDDRVVQYLPWLAQHTDQNFRLITLRQLLWHGAGMMREGGQVDFWQLQSPFPGDQDLKRLVLDSKLVQTSGDKFKYSNLGYALLGQIIAKVSGRSYAAYVHEHILAPLHMTTTDVYNPANEFATATAYLRPFSGSRPAMPKAVPTHTFDSATGWYSNLDDLGRFVDGLSGNTPQWLDSATLEQLFTNERQHWLPPEQRGTEYGLGFFIEHRDNRRIVGHSGGFSGYHTCTYADVDNKLAVIVLANAKDTPVSHMAEGIFGIYDFFDEYATQPLPPKLQRCNVRLMNLWETFEIVCTSKLIACIDPKSWSPFDDLAKTLQIIDDTTLRVMNDDDLSYNAELVKFYFDHNDTVTHVNYAGITCVPEKRYSQWIANKKIT
ncbi:MAG TPA: serine hydrolase domain-containing protein [Patescibacteria group bacterium]|jgi:D-alanyl-D-alanine carboxypeptidase|nr:serine hydrolase domain-containing protein [Patescibacteria group bacterium]